MKFTSSDQRKAMFARLNKDGALKKAAVGLGIAATAGVIAYKAQNTALARKAAAVAIGGLTGAAGIVGSQFERAQAIEQDIRSKAKATAMMAKLNAQNQSAAVLEAVRGVNVEKIAATGVDWAFQVPEALLAHQIMKRVATLEAVAASKLGEMQAATAATVADKARTLHAKTFGATTEADMHRAAAELYKLEMEELTKRRKLRTQTQWSQMRMMQAVEAGMRDMQKKMTAMPTENDVRMYLARQNEDATPEKIREYMNWYRRMMAVPAGMQFDAR